jgi:pilus assembly protein CpaB
MGAVAFLAVGLLCAAFAAFLIKNMISARGYTGDRVRPVVVAKHALPAAVAITPDDVDVMNWPEKHVPDGVVADPTQLFAPGKPLIPTTAILEGEPIVPSRLASQQQGTGLAALVRDGYRAVAVKVDDSVGRSGLVYPGATVDVLATIRDQDHGPSTRIAVSGAKVLAVEDQTDVATRRPKKTADDAQSDISKGSFYGTVVTLEVTPDDAEIVSLASREGKVDLALRNGTDKKPAETKGAIPLYFSAFAPDVAPSTAGPSGGVPTQTVPGTSESRSGHGGRRIEMRAVDSGRNRRENPGKEIETYHAR